MINPRMNNSRSAPAWAVLGAPLLGVPLLVGLLSLVAPEPTSVQDDHAPMVTIERVDEVSGVRPVTCPGPEPDVRTG